MPLAYGRALLANGRAAEALEPLRQSYGFWLGHDPKSVWAAEAEYWFALAYIASGDVKRGRWMVAEVKRALAKSPYVARKACRRRLAGRRDCCAVHTLSGQEPASSVKFHADVRFGGWARLYQQEAVIRTDSPDWRTP